jgi:hypothetical protein
MQDPFLENPGVQLPGPLRAPEDRVPEPEGVEERSRMTEELVRQKEKIGVQSAEMRKLRGSMEMLAREYKKARGL